MAVKFMGKNPQRRIVRQIPNKKISHRIETIKEENNELKTDKEMADNRLEKIEEIGNSVEGVDKAYAIQAGRELRVVVKPEEVDDLMSYQIARSIKEKIESDVQYPGTVKVTVIRETRVTEEAK